MQGKRVKKSPRKHLVHYAEFPPHGNRPIKHPRNTGSSTHPLHPNCIVELFSFFPFPFFLSFFLFFHPPLSRPPFFSLLPRFSKCVYTPSITFGNIRGRPTVRQTINLFSSSIDWGPSDVFLCFFFFFS